MENRCRQAANVTLLLIRVCLVTWRGATCEWREDGAPTGVHVLAEAFSCEFRSDNRCRKHPDSTKEATRPFAIILNPCFRSADHRLLRPWPRNSRRHLQRVFQGTFIRCQTTRTKLMAKLFKIKLSVNFPFVHPSPTLCRAAAAQWQHGKQWKYFRNFSLYASNF